MSAVLGYDERELCAALRRGDEAAFVALVERYHAPLRRLALSYVRSPAVADEVVQETWLGVIKGIQTFEGRASLKTWIYRILTNTAQTRGLREARSVPVSSAATTHPPSTRHVSSTSTTSAGPATGRARRRAGTSCPRSISSATRRSTSSPRQSRFCPRSNSR